MTIVSARSGYDLEYYLERARGEKTAGGYYINAAQKGEDPGRWFGRGAELLGFQDGQQVTRDPYLAAYDVIDPRTGEKLPGRRPAGYAKFAEIFKRKLDAEPHATRERWLELEREAAKETRRSPAYTDATASHNKSVSVLRASFLENARQARVAGDAEAETLWQSRADRAAEIEQEANHAALVHLQEWAGFVRTGYHGRKVDGIEPGRWASAGLIVTTWRQGTNRDGEPHDHSHNVIARHAITDSDGVCRSVDTMAVRVQLPAMAAIIESRIRSAFSREFGVRWRARADGRGHEIDGIPDHVLAAFSRRTQRVTQKARQLARVWEQKYGRAPNAREMLFIQDEANLASRRGKGDELVDWDRLAAKWDRTSGGELADLADICDFDGPKISAAPSAEVQDKAIQDALQAVQAAHSTWTRSDLIRYLGWAMGPEFDALAEDDRHAMLNAMADQGLSTGYGTVCLEAPEWPAPPPQLMRPELDQRSVFTRPGTARYATRGQLSMEQRLCDQAQRQGAPTLTREFAAQQLGAGPEELDQALHTRAEDATQLTHTGLRFDQAAMIYEGMTSPRRVSVGVGPAGSGKTHTVAAGARAWEANGGVVIGVTCSQAARNVLAHAGVKDSYNSAMLRELLDQGMPIKPGTLFVIDEGSMMSTSDLAWLIDLAKRTDSKVFLTGDHQQLAAVENGGGMQLAANHLGFTQLITPVRFVEHWERDASLKLRDGDETALDQYEQHGRIEGGSKEEIFDAARRAYVAGRLAGQNQILMAFTRESCRELGRQIRDDLLHLGLVDAGESKQLAHGAQCSAGDLIVCRDNDHDLITDRAEGEDHELANGDVFRVDSMVEDGAIVRRVLDSGAVADAFLYADHKLRASDLAYARTGHNGQGGTFDESRAVFTGGETLEWLYVAMTRGRQRNTAMTITHDGVREETGEAIPHKAADPAPGTRPDPELARAERVERERLGLPLDEPERPEHEREPIAVLADCMERRDFEDSASEYQRQQLANADHLSILGARWDNLAGRAERERHEPLVLSMTDEQFHGQIKEAMTWISRNLRSAELAGMDTAEVLQVALARPLEGLEHAGKGLQARLRRITDPLVPQPVRPYAERVPEVDDPEIQNYLQDLAIAQDERADRQGEHAAETSPSWAVRQLGPVPDDPVERLDWTQRAATIEKYRGRYGIEGDDLGPEPTNNTPDMRARWWDAVRAANKSDTIDFRELPDKSLVHMVNSYKSETGWAPPHVGRQLREVRMNRESLRLQRIRAEAEAQNAADQVVAARHEGIARDAHALELLYQVQEKVLDDAQKDRELWEAFSRGARQIAVQADSELRLRYPKIKMQPLKSAEPEAPNMTQPGWLEDLNKQREMFRQELEYRQGQEIPDEDPDVKGQEAWPSWEAQRHAILQPPKEPIKPAEKVLERVRDGEQDR